MWGTAASSWLPLDGSANRQIGYLLAMSNGQVLVAGDPRTAVGVRMPAVEVLAGWCPTWSKS